MQKYQSLVFVFLALTDGDRHFLGSNRSLKLPTDLPIHMSSVTMYEVAGDVDARCCDHRSVSAPGPRPPDSRRQGGHILSSPGHYSQPRRSANYREEFYASFIVDCKTF